MWAKLRLRERVERCGNGSEGRSGGGESHPACRDRTVPRSGGSCGTRGAEGDEGWSMREQEEGAELPPRIPFPLGGRWRHGTRCTAFCQHAPLGQQWWGWMVSSGSTLPFFFEVEGTFHLKKEGKNHPNLGRDRFKKLNKKGRVN